MPLNSTHAYAMTSDTTINHFTGVQKAPEDQPRNIGYYKLVM